MQKAAIVVWAGMLATVGCVGDRNSHGGSEPPSIAFTHSASLVRQEDEPVVALPSAFKAYNTRVVEEIRTRWYALLAPVKQGRSGKVVLEFKQHSSGRVSDVIRSEFTTTDFLAGLCEQAVLDAQPFGAWPGEMRTMIGKDYRVIRFTFYYQ